MLNVWPIYEILTLRKDVFVKIRNLAMLLINGSGTFVNLLNINIIVFEIFK